MANEAIHADDRVVIVDRAGADGGPIDHGVTALRDAIAGAGGTVETVEHWTATDRGAVLLVGTRESRVVRRLLDDVPRDPGALAYRWRDLGGGTALVAAGGGERGAMYALLELAERVEARGVGALAAVEGGIGTPDNEVRGVDRFVTGPVADDWLYDDDFWRDHLDRLARSRFNRFVLIAGYDTAFLSPPYPFVVEVPGFEGVGVADDVGVTRAETRAQLRRIGALCRERGIEFVFGIWQQRPWTDAQGTLVEGLPEDAYADYCAAGLRTLLVECPEIDGVQLRVNFESGVTAGGDRGTAEAFWNRLVEAVDEAGAERGDPVALNLRAKGLTDGMIDHALETGQDLTVPTKFWCESTGLPYHNSRMRAGELANLDDPNRARRYSYADLLEEPRAYDVLYRLWVVGTNRLFVWGDPEYAERFARAAGFGDGAGFEVTAPLSLKGGHYALQDGPWPVFDDPDLRDYDHEDDRYWAWYRLFGRLGYAADADPDVWRRAFRARFGDAAADILAGYRAASKVLPLVTAFHLTQHPALTNWAELDTGGALFADHNHNPAFGDTTYATAEPSDPGLFYGIDEYVRDDLAGDHDGRYTPVQVAGWLAHLAAETRDAVAAAEAGDPPDTGEYAATVLDLRMLADLAEFHAHKVHAAAGLCRYRETDDPDHLPGAHASARAMRDAWASLAGRGEGTYHDDLVFGNGPAVADEGQWRDRLDEIEADAAALGELLDEADIDPRDEPPDPSRAGGFGRFPTPGIALDVPDAHPAGEDLPVTARPPDLDGIETPWLCYRHADQTEGAFRRVAMERVDGGYRATIPGEYVTPEWDLLVYAAAVDADGNGLIVPGLYHPDHPFPYRVVDVEGEV